MPYEIRFIERVVLIRFHGQVTAADIAEFTEAVTGRADFDEQRFHILDFTDALLPPLDDDLLVATSTMVGATQTNRRLTALVIPESASTRALVAFLEPTLGSLTVDFFPSTAAALDWISTQSGTMRVPIMR